MSKPRLLVLTSTFPRWRDDHEPPFVYELARRLTDLFEITVLAPHAPGAARRETMDGIRVERFRYAPDALEKLAYAGGIPVRLRRHPWLALLIPFFLLAQLIAAWRLVRNERPAVLHAHWIITGGLIARLVRVFVRRRFRLVLTAHGGDVYGLRHPVLTRLKRWVLSDVDAATAVSQALSEELVALGAPSDRITVQPMGTDLQQLFVPADRRDVPPRVIYAGRLVAKKGVDTLLRAFAKARESRPELQLQIAGHGPEQAALEALAAELGIDEHVEFSGPYRLRDLPRLYARANLAVFPFRVAEDGDQDGLGLAIVEAMGCGVPVITTRLPILTELAEDDVTARTVEADNVDALNSTIVAHFASPSQGHRLSIEARQRALERFDWQPVAACYGKLLSGTVSPADVPSSQAKS